jgi:tetratricopeptide (TPR) repeat protein
MRVLAELGRYAEATAVLDALPGGSPRTGPWCVEHAAGLPAAALVPLLGTGRGPQAVSSHRDGLRTVVHDRTRLHLLADHLDFLRLTANGAAAVELARTHAALLRAGCTAAHRLRWLTAAAHAVAEQVAAGHGDDLVTVAWPEHPIEPMTLADFSLALHARATPLAAAFDARNGSRMRVQGLTDHTRHEAVRTALPVDLSPPGPATQQGPSPGAPARGRAPRPPITVTDVLAGPDPYATAEDALLCCTLADPVGVWEELVLRAGPREAAARAVLARVLCLAGQRDRCLAEVAIAEAMNTADGNRVAAAATKATAAACWVQVDPPRGLALAEQAADALAQLPPCPERDVALCRAHSARVAALLALEKLDEAKRWVVELHPVHPGQQVRVACQHALVLRLTGELAEAVAVLHAGARVADEHGLVALGVEVRMDLAELLEDLGDADGAVRALRRALLDLPHVPEPDPLEVPRTRMDLARVLSEAGRLVPARAELRRARAELRAFPDTVEEQATADYLLGVVLRGLGELPAALTHLAAAATAFAQVDRPDGAVLAERDRGAVLFALDREAEAAAAFDAAAEAGRMTGADWRALACQIDAAQVRGYSGMPGATTELHRLRAVLAMTAAESDVADQELAFQTARVDHALAHCALAADDVARAAELAELALAGYRAAGAVRAVAALSVDAGAWWWQAGDTGSALHYLRSALRSARELGDGALIARCSAALDSVEIGDATTRSDADTGPPY